VKRAPESFAPAVVQYYLRAISHAKISIFT